MPTARKTLPHPWPFPVIVTGGKAYRVAVRRPKPANVPDALY